MASGTTNYQWDGNGNMLSAINTVNTAQNKSFTYNLLNLPLVVTIPNGTATYTYDAGGNKLRKADVLNGSPTATDYISGIQYNTSLGVTAISFIQTEEGKAVPTTAGGYDYMYYLGDNLGNTRVTFDTQYGYADTLQRDDYYPFGLEINRSTSGPKNEYLYNRKELQDEFTEYDYGARFYDPVIARWTSVDPLAEEYRRWSPYNYGVNNPIGNTDPDGMGPCPECATLNLAALKGVGQSLWGSVTGVYNAVRHPVNTAKAIAHAVAHPINTAKAIGKAVSKGYNNFKNGDNETKANIVGNLGGDVVQLFVGTEEVKAATETVKATEVAGAANDVFHVTEDGVVIPKGEKYKIPDELVENPNRKGSYGTVENGKFKEEKLRIDPATEPGKKGPNTSHYHKNGKSTHYVPNGKDPGFN